jgi:hypothetical protein
MLSSPYRRASFIVAIVGVLALCTGAYDWLTTYPNAFLSRTTTVPDYPRPDDQIVGRKSVIQIHRRCEWRDDPPPNANMFDRTGPVMLHDLYLALDGACAEKLLDRRSYNVAGPLLVFSTRSFQLMLRDALKDTHFRTDKDENLSAQALYRYNIAQEMQRLGVQRADALRVLDACTKSEARYCVEVQRYFYVNVWSVIWSTWPLALGFVLFVGGMAGSLFLTPIAALWGLSGGRLVDWIRRGS